VGIHPNSSNSWDAWTEESLEMLSSHGKAVAIGEIGLDYYRDRAPKEHQKLIFRKQLALADQKKLPVVIHVRNANENDRSCIDDVLEILAGWGPGRQLPGVIHSYSGNIEEANRFIEMGFFLGITGPVTYPKAETLREVVAAVPLDRLLIETDSPFLSPQPRRGRRNEPAFVRYVAEKIAAIRAQPLEVVASQVCLNATRLFGWEESSPVTP
jgi:TatD DNase family protein